MWRVVLGVAGFIPHWDCLFTREILLKAVVFGDDFNTSLWIGYNVDSQEHDDSAITILVGWSIQISVM